MMMFGCFFSVFVDVLTFDPRYELPFNEGDGSHVGLESVYVSQ